MIAAVGVVFLVVAVVGVVVLVADAAATARD